jgi:hypothetical protein
MPLLAGHVAVEIHASQARQIVRQMLSLHMTQLLLLFRTLLEVLARDTLASGSTQAGCDQTGLTMDLRAQEPPHLEVSMIGAVVQDAAIRHQPPGAATSAVPGAAAYVLLRWCGQDVLRPE